MSEKPRVLIEVLTTYERTGWVCKELAEWLWKLPFNLDYVTSVAWAHNFSPAAAARNFICYRIRETPKSERPDWIMMVDNDMPVPDNVLDCLKDVPADAGAVIPRFYMWDPQKQVPVLCWGVKEPTGIKGEVEMLTIEMGHFYELTKGGTGVVFIRPDMLDDLGDEIQNADNGPLASPGLFYYTFDKNGSRLSTEDINFFTKKVAATKWKIYGCSSVEVGHYHNVNLADLARYIFQTETRKREVEAVLAPECMR